MSLKLPWRSDNCFVRLVFGLILSIIVCVSVCMLITNEWNHCVSETGISFQTFGVFKSCDIRECKWYTNKTGLKKGLQAFAVLAMIASFFSWLFYCFNITFKKFQVFAFFSTLTACILFLMKSLLV